MPDSCSGTFREPAKPPVTHLMLEGFNFSRQWVILVLPLRNDSVPNPIWGIGLPQQTNKFEKIFRTYLHTTARAAALRTFLPEIVVIAGVPAKNGEPNNGRQNNGDPYQFKLRCALGATDCWADFSSPRLSFE
jgi:hypothetical protein